VGKAAKVIVDGPGPSRGHGGMLQTRSYGEAPEIDPCIFVAAEIAPETQDAGAFREIPLGRHPGRTHVRRGEFLEVTITDSREYDLVAEMRR